MWQIKDSVAKNENFQMQCKKRRVGEVKQVTAVQSNYLDR